MFEFFQNLNPHSFWKISLSCCCYESLSKTNRFNYFMSKPTRKKNWGGEGIWIFVEVFFVTSEIGFLELTWRVTMLQRCNLEILQWKNSSFFFFEIYVHLLVKISNLKFLTNKCTDISERNVGFNFERAQTSQACSNTTPQPDFGVIGNIAFPSNRNK